MISIKDMLYQLNELRRENDDLKDQIDHHLAQQRWFMHQIDGLHQDYGACYNQLQNVCLELYNLKHPTSFIEPQQTKPINLPEHQAQLDMLQADLESHFQERLFAKERIQAASLQVEHARVQAELTKNQMDSARVQAEQFKNLVEQARVQAEQARVQAEQARAQAEQARAQAEQARAQAKQTSLENEALLFNYKTQLELLSQKAAETDQKHAAIHQKLKDCQEDLQTKASHIKNQKETIHRLQSQNINITEKLAVTESMLREAKKEVGVATDLFNELSMKMSHIKGDHTKTVRELNQTINSLRATNSKMVHKAVEQAKIIQKLNSKVHVTFQVDKETTEEVFREGYNDLQKFVEKKAMHMEHILALVAYGLTHLKYVIEKFVFERLAEHTASVSCDFLNQVINQLTRIFLIIPIPVMTRNIDRLTDLAAEQCISMKALHMIQYALPETVEDAQASRQRVVLTNFPELNQFFTTERATNDETVCVSLSGFMLLLGISK